MKKPLPAILLFFGLFIITIAVAGILLFKSGFMPSLITDMFPKKPAQHIDIAVDNPASAPKPSSKSSSPLEPISQQTDVAPEVETGSHKTIAPPPPADPVQTLPPFQEKLFTVQFPLDSNEFSPEAYTLLDNIIDTVLKYRGLEIFITGYTDSIGNKDYNKQLSKFRATVVKIYMVGNGIDSKQIFVSGMGPENPIATNDTREGRQLNRRVEIKLLSEQ